MDRKPYADNMKAKLAWMQRSRARIHAGESDINEVQDHFLSYVHASQLNWHYFGAYCVSVGLPKKEPQRIINKWLSDNLTEPEADVWTFLNDLRNEDVHVKSVEALRTSEPQVVSIGGVVPSYGGVVPSYGKHCYSVTLKSQDWEIFELTKDGLVVMGKFIKSFEEGLVS